MAERWGGAAQQRTKAGLLHQGTISLAPPDLDYIERVLLPGSSVIAGMRANSLALLLDAVHLEEARAAMKAGSIRAFTE